jgi:hypothetical protein
MDTAARAVVQGNPEPQGRTTLETVLKLVNNILKAQSEPKFRTLRTANSKIRAQVMDAAGGPELLRAVGFEPVPDPPDTLMIPMDADLVRLMQARQALNDALSSGWQHAPTPAVATTAAPPAREAPPAAPQPLAAAQPAISPLVQPASAPAAAPNDDQARTAARLRALFTEELAVNGDATAAAARAMERLTREQQPSQPAALVHTSALKPSQSAAPALTSVDSSHEPSAGAFSPAAHDGPQPMDAEDEDELHAALAMSMDASGSAVGDVSKDVSMDASMDVSVDVSVDAGSAGATGPSDLLTRADFERRVRALFAEEQATGADPTTAAARALSRAQAEQLAAAAAQRGSTSRPTPPAPPTPPPPAPPTHAPVAPASAPALASHDSGGALVSFERLEDVEKVAQEQVDDINALYHSDGIVFVDPTFPPIPRSLYMHPDGYTTFRWLSFRPARSAPLQVIFFSPLT